MSPESKNPAVYLDAIEQTVQTINNEEELQEIEGHIGSLRGLTKSPTDILDGNHYNWPAVAYFAGHLVNLTVEYDPMAQYSEVSLQYRVTDFEVERWENDG